MKLSNFATRNVVSIRPDDGLDKAISLMEEHGFRHLPVVEGRRLVGMISERDLMLSVGWKLSIERQVSIESDAVAGPSFVHQIMIQSVTTATMDTTLHAAAGKLIDRNISALPLTDGNGHLVGIVTRYDLLKRSKDLAGSDPALDVLQQPVRDHMRAHVHTVGIKDLLVDAAHLMHEKHVRHLPVVAQGQLFGMISDRDLRRATGEETIEDERSQEAGGFYIGATKVMDVMTRHVATTTPDARLAKAVEQMVMLRIGALPVVRGEEMVGIITDTDIVRAIGAADI